MIAALWNNRQRPACLSLAWFRCWAKRVLLLPNLCKQWRFHRRLANHGATIAPTVFFSDASLIDGAAIRNLRIGEDSFIGRAEIIAHAEVTIGCHVCINDEAKLITASHDVRDPAWRSVSSPISIGDYAWIATRAMILPGVRIGKGAVVGAGAVVSRDVGDYELVVGNPAQPLKKFRTETLRYSPLRFLALYNAWLGEPPTKSYTKTESYSATCPQTIHKSQ